MMTEAQAPPLLAGEREVQTGPCVPSFHRPSELSPSIHHCVPKDPRTTGLELDILF